MESYRLRNLSYVESEVETKVEATKNLNERPESPEECVRSETPSSDASTSGVCSMASSDFECSEENVAVKTDRKGKSLGGPLIEHGFCNHLSKLKSDFILQETVLMTEGGSSKVSRNELVIIYEKRNILDIFENIYPFSVYQTTNVPKMNMSNYWDRRSIYHRLGPYGTVDELDYRKCHYCDFYTTVPKYTICKGTS